MKGGKGGSDMKKIAGKQNKFPQRIAMASKGKPAKGGKK